ncbi:MAG: EAL domain-containing protein [Pseudomonadota bacterium]|nr:EAL domain-containing protein [Pseudomonadota bacterium]
MDERTSSLPPVLAALLLAGLGMAVYAQLWPAAILAGLGLIGGGLFLFWRWTGQRLARMGKQLADIIDSIPEGFVLCDAEDRLVACNEQYRRLYPGVREIAVPGVAFSQLVLTFLRTDAALPRHGSIDEALAARMARHRNPGPPFEHELRDGRRIRITERRTGDGGSVGIHADITDIRQTEERLQYLAHHDPLTGLPNRGYCLERLEQALARARRRHSGFAVMYLDLDRFKQVNDTLGHAVGDALLQAVARRLKGHLRDEDTLARLGGDEFMVILEDMEDPAVAAAFARRLTGALARPFQVQGHELAVTASVGVALYPENGTDIATLMQNADAASYHAKAQGPNNYRLYTPALHAAASQRLDLELELRQALEGGQLVLHYQPVVALAGGHVTRVEALLRWQHPVRGLLGPAQFLDLAGEAGLGGAIDDWVLRQAIRQYDAWRAAGLAPPRLAVNLSRHRFVQPRRLVDGIARILAETGLPPGCLDLEINEKFLDDEADALAEHLHRLTRRGVGLAIDDFGTGSLPLSRLQRLPLTALKVDPSLVQGMIANAGHLTLITTVLVVARHLKLEVMAEGVESGAQLALLRECGCAEGQGNLFSPPLAAAAFADWLHRSASRADGGAADNALFYGRG